jgi:hypothetical protein
MQQQTSGKDGKKPVMPTVPDGISIALAFVVCVGELHCIKYCINFRIVLFLRVATTGHVKMAPQVG